jgi:HK97 family phage portal protein
MTFFDLLERRGNPLENPSTSFNSPAVWEWMGGETTSAGESITYTTAMTVGAYYAGVRFIAETLGSLPCKLYRQDGRMKEVLYQDPRHIRLNSVANPDMTAGTVREVMQGHLVTWGNAYAYRVYSRRGMLEELWPLRPDHMTPLMDGGRIVAYQYVDERGTETVFAPGQILHIPGFGFDGRVGYSVVSLARESLGLAKAGEKSAGKLFGNGLQASGVLVHPQTMTEKTRSALKKAVESQIGGDGRSGLLVLEGGMQFEQMGIPPGDAQFLESRQFSVVEMARWLDLPPHILKDLTHATYSNIESQSLELVVYSLRRWFVRWEQHLNKSLLSEQERANGLYFKVEDRALLRGDTASRGQWYRERFQLGSLSPNDIRALEDENEVDGGDQYFVNAAMIPLDQAMSLTVDERARLMHGDTEPTPEPRAGIERLAAGTVWAQLVRGELRTLRRRIRREEPLPEYYEGEFMEFGRKVLGDLFRQVGRDDMDAMLQDYATDALRTMADVTDGQLAALLDGWHDRADEWADRFLS